jgi:Polysaccharide pyruvyl transferase
MNPPERTHALALPALLLDLPVAHHIPRAALLPAAQVDALAGSNAGNFAFRYALSELFFPGTQVGTFQTLNDMPRRMGTVVVACANWIGNTPEHADANEKRWGSLSDFESPVVPFGLGCQLPLHTRFDDLILPTRKFLLRLCELAPSISVRDEQTAELLHSIGYRKARVTGCPSNFINPDPGLGAQVGAAARRLLSQFATWQELALCLTEYSGGYDTSSRVFEQHFALMRDHAATYVVQDYPLLPVLMGQGAPLPQEYQSAQFPGTGADDARMRLVLRRSAVYFAAYEQWLLHARRFDLAFGMRLHGNITTFQAGVPSMVITHDARTAQSCRTIGLPSMPAKSFLEQDLRSPEPLLQCIADTVSAYDARRRDLARSMVDHLRSSELTVPPMLLPLIA